MDQISVAKGAKSVVEPGSLGDFAQWWVLDVWLILRALLAFAVFNTALLGDPVWLSAGVPTGGVMSTACMSIALAYAEALWKHSQSKRFGANFKICGPIEQSLAWRRIADSR